MIIYILFQQLDRANYVAIRYRMLSSIDYNLTVIEGVIRTRKKVNLQNWDKFYIFKLNEEERSSLMAEAEYSLIAIVDELQKKKVHMS